MNRYVSDTHALFWHFTDSPKLGTRARAAFAEAVRGEAQIIVPAIVVAELYYMNVKLWRALDFVAAFQRLRSGPQFVLLPFLPDDTEAFDDNSAVPEMHDRIIVGVARLEGVPLITRDVAIAASGLVVTIW